MAKAVLEGVKVDIVEPDDWTTRELYEAEKALGLTYDGSSAGGALAITMFISLRRVQTEKGLVQLADEVMGMKFGALSDLAQDEEQAPLETPFGPAVPPTTGHPLSAVSE